MLDTTLYRRDSMDNDTDWKEYASAKVERTLDCTIGHDEVGSVTKKNSKLYSCHCHFLCSDRKLKM